MTNEEIKEHIEEFSKHAKIISEYCKDQFRVNKLTDGGTELCCGDCPFFVREGLSILYETYHKKEYEPYDYRGYCYLTHSNVNLPFLTLYYESTILGWARKAKELLRGEEQQ